MGRTMKILSIITIMALLLGGRAAIPVAAAPEVTVSIDAPAQATPGSGFTANVNISQVTNFDACNYDVSFNASVLRLDNVTSGLIGSTTIPVDVYNQISSGTYRIVQNVSGMAGVSGSGYLAVLHFHVIGSAGTSSTISLANGVVSDNAAREIKPTWRGNSVKITAATHQETAPPAVTLTPQEPVPRAVISSAPEETTPPQVNNPPPEVSAPDKAAPSPVKPINWPVLWGVMGGVFIIGVIVLMQAIRRTYY